MSEIDATAPQNTERSPRRGMCAAVLCLEAITIGLTVPVMVTIADVAVGTALVVGLGLAVVCLLLAGMLRAPWAYTAGYVVQVAAIGLGFVIPMMFLPGRHLRRTVGSRGPPRSQDRAREGGGLGGLPRRTVLTHSASDSASTASALISSSSVGPPKPTTRPDRSALRQ